MSWRVALVGHVDHGKSTLIGRLLADTGQVKDERREKVQSICASTGRRFEYAFLLDAFEEEQAQGITIDVTELGWNFHGREFIFVDTPGHREFIKKMVGGASQVDAAIMILDAQEGLKNTFHHQARILDLLGIRQQIILLNKMDLVGWSESVWELRCKELNQAFDRILAARPMIIPVAAWLGDNLLEASKKMPWYSGPCVAEALMQLHNPRDITKLPARFFVQDIYRFDDRRITVGRIEAGKLRVGEEIRFFPGGQKTQIKSIEVYGENRSEAKAGDAIGLIFADPLYLERGALGFPLKLAPIIADHFTAELFWLDTKPLQHGDQVRLKNGTQVANAIVEKIESVFDLDSFSPMDISGGISAFGRVQFRVIDPWAFDHFEQCEATGRFVVLKDGKVLGGGRCVAGSQQYRRERRVSLGEREARAGHEGRVFWLTGLSGSGKSTIARELERKLFDSGVGIVVLDGDDFRQGISKDLGFSAADRKENIRRVAEVAKLMANTGLFVVTAFISPFAEDRRLAKDIVGAARFVEVFIECPLAECETRDPKGLYAKARGGGILDFTGIDSPFEAPQNPDFRIRTDQSTVAKAVGLLEELFRELQST